MPAVLTFAPIRGATEDEQQCYEALKFQSTRPLRGATLHVVVEHVFLVISIHAPLTGRDVCVLKVPVYRQHFNPRAPYGARLLLDQATD